MVCSAGMGKVYEIPCDKRNSWLSRILTAVNAFSQKKLNGRQKDALQETAKRKAADFLDRYGDTILRCAYLYLHNMPDAEDVLQDTLIQYIRTKPSLESEAHEKAWLLRVASNLSKNRLRYNTLRATDELQEDLALEQNEDLGFVWEAVKSLPDKQREAVHLHYYEGYTTAEFSGIVGRKESTVRSDLRRGREKLKSILKEAYDFEQQI